MCLLIEKLIRLGITQAICKHLYNYIINCKQHLTAILKLMLAYSLELKREIILKHSRHQEIVILITSRGFHEITSQQVFENLKHNYLKPTINCIH